MRTSEVTSSHARRNDTTHAGLRQTFLPFSIHPLPKWVAEVGWYRWDIPDGNVPGAEITIRKWRDRTTIYPPAGVHRYCFPLDGECRCQEYHAGRRIARYCRHEQLAWIVRVYLTCPKCARLSDPLRQFELRHDERGTFLGCLTCEDALAAQGFEDVEAITLRPSWLGRGYNAPEMALLTAFFTSLQQGFPSPISTAASARARTRKGVS